MPPPERPPASNAAFAEGFAQLFDVVQRGVRRRATPADLLELLEPRYVLKQGELYLGRKGWRRRQREAQVVGQLDEARAAQEIARREFGVETRIVRVRRRGTVGIEAYAMREGLEVKEMLGGAIGLGVSEEEAVGMLKALTGAGAESGGRHGQA